MEIPGLRAWIFFYLISFVVLLFAAFLSAQGVMLWVSLFLAVLVIGINFVTVSHEIKKHTLRTELQRSLIKGFRHEGEEEGKSP